MCSDTGKVSFLLYGLFIALSLFSLLFVYRLIKKETGDPGKFDKFLDYFKWTVSTLAVSTVTLIVSDLFKEREQDIRELEYFNTYLTDVKNEENPRVRLQLAKFLSIVAPGGDMKQSWTNYYDTIRREYEGFLEAQLKLDRDTGAHKKDTSQDRREENLEKVHLFNTPLSSGPGGLTEWLIVTGGDRTLPEATFELNKAKLLNENAAIYLRKGSYRTVLRGYNNLSEAEQQLSEARRQLNKEAYIVDRASWCPDVKQGEDCLICK